MNYLHSSGNKGKAARPSSPENACGSRSDCGLAKKDIGFVKEGQEAIIERFLSVHTPLGAGMAVTAEIRTGDRRILEYIFSPLTQIASEALRER